MTHRTAKATLEPLPPESVEPLNTYVCDRIKQLRKRKGWTLDQLASVSGVSRSMLSQVERGVANPTLAVAFRIASAFGLSLGDLVDGAIEQTRMHVIRGGDADFVFRDDKNCKIRTLSPLNLEKDVEFYELQLLEGGCLESEAHFEGTREFLTVQAGKIRVLSADEESVLEAGDSVQYPADVHHLIENTGVGDATVFLVVIYSNQR